MDDLTEFESLARVNTRSGPCPDDCERTAPYIDILPAESETEHGSPLNFGDGS